MSSERVPTIVFHRGTPEGSLVSPLLSKFYVDDLLNSLDDINQYTPSVYAGDLAFTDGGSCMVESALKVILHWCLENNMEVNWSKTLPIQVLPHSSPKGCSKDPFSFGNGQYLEFA